MNMKRYKEKRAILLQSFVYPMTKQPTGQGYYVRARCDLGEIIIRSNRRLTEGEIVIAYHDKGYGVGDDNYWSEEGYDQTGGVER